MPELSRPSVALCCKTERKGTTEDFSALHCTLKEIPQGQTYSIKMNWSNGHQMQSRSSIDWAYQKKPEYDSLKDLYVGSPLREMYRDCVPGSL